MRLVEILPATLFVGDGQPTSYHHFDQIISSLSQRTKDTLYHYLSQFYHLSAFRYCSDALVATRRTRSGINEYITRISDGALLWGGWNIRRNATFAPQMLTYCRPVNLPMEWWKGMPGRYRSHSLANDLLSYDPMRPVRIDMGETTDPREYGMELVYRNSSQIPEVLYFLCAERYFEEEHDIRLNFEAGYWRGTTCSEDMFIPRQDSGSLTLHGKFDEIGRAIPSTQPEDQSVKEGMNKRTLRYLLDQIKARFKELTSNERAYTWMWLNEVLYNCWKNDWERHLRSKKSTLLSDKEINDYQNAHKARVCATLTKYCGFEWIFLPDEVRFYPRKMVKSYVMGMNPNDLDENFFADETGLQEQTYKPVVKWCLANQWERWKVEGKLKWDGINNNWVWHSFYHLVCDSTDPYRTHEEGISETFYKKYQICSSCHGYFVKKLMHEDYDLGMHNCPICLPRIRSNPIITRDASFGAYHSHRGWKFLYNRTEKDDKREFCYGMEVEMQAKKGMEGKWAKEAAWSILQAQYKHIPNANHIYFERDGSLMEGGLEMVTNPMSLAYHKEYWNKLLPYIREVCVGWNTEDVCGPGASANNYGIHITFSRKWWTDLQLARLVKFIDNPKNQSFVRGLAQRTVIYSGEVLADKHRTLSEKVQISAGKIRGSMNRYVPVNVKGPLVELRFFRTTLNTESYLKNLEWLHAFHQWVRNTAFSDDAIQFIDWITKDDKRVKLYPNLVSFYTRERIPCKGVILRNPYRPVFKDALERVKIESTPTEGESN